MRAASGATLRLRWAAKALHRTREAELDGPSAEGCGNAVVLAVGVGLAIFRMALCEGLLQALVFPCECRIAAQQLAEQFSLRVVLHADVASGLGVRDRSASEMFEHFQDSAQ